MIYTLTDELDTHSIFNFKLLAKPSVQAFLVGSFKLIMEIWKKASFLDNKYSISSLGRIKSHKYDIVMKKSIDRYGYEYVQLGKLKYKVHRLVAMHFLPKGHTTETVHHKDSNKLNNCVDNLEWATFSEQNQEHKGYNIYFMGKCYNSIRSASRSTGVDRRKVKKLSILR